MKLTLADKSTLIHALNLAIRDKLSGIDPDAAEPDAIQLNSELQADAEKFKELRDRIGRSLAT